MNQIAQPAQVLSFAYALQNTHFREGKDLITPATYDEVYDKLSLPRLDTS